MKYILIFIYRVLNLICFGCIGLFALTFPIWPLFVYLFIGEKGFDYDVDEWFKYIYKIIHKPLDKFDDYIDNIDDNFSISFNSKFWQ